MTDALAEGTRRRDRRSAPVANVIAFPGGRDELETAVVQAEAAVAQSRHRAAVVALRGVPRHGREPRLVLRALHAESWARMMLGDLHAARVLAESARSLAEAELDDVDHAEALHRLGCVHFKLAEISVASTLFTLALELCKRTGQPCQRLRSRLYEWRSRCHQRHREWDAARADAERALELATAAGDDLAAANAQLQASLVAERTGQRLLARFYTEQARDRFERQGNRLMLARTLTNLGRLTFQLGDTDEAASQLESAAAVARELGSDADAAQAVSTLARLHLHDGHLDLAEREAREALDALGERVDYADELGGAQLVLGRTLLAQGRYDEAAAHLAAAEDSFEQIEAYGQRAAVWLAQGDLAAARGARDRGAELYRRAAESLQDLHF